MASESEKKRPTAGECLVNATCKVLDNVMIQVHLDRASAETSRRLGAYKIESR
jgi:hypothetical protein